MKELSQETKAKVLACYLGHEVLTNTKVAQGEGKPFKKLRGILKEIDMGMVTKFMGVLLENEKDVCNQTDYSPEQCKLILRPIQELTNEELIKFMGIHSSMSQRPLINKFTVSHNVLTIDYFYSQNSQETYMVNDLSARQVDFLRSIGIDLPHYLLDTEWSKRVTLKEAGLAIYESDLK